MKMTMKRTKKSKKVDRRYPLGMHPVYDRAYDQAFNNSDVPKNEFRALSNLNVSLLELEGNPAKEGYYLRGNTWHLAALPYHEEELKKLKIRFFEWAKLQVKNGNSLEAPTEWPKELFELRLKREALLDVRRREAVIIKKLIADKQAENEANRKASILPCGAIGQPNGSTAYEQEQNPGIDGQRLSFTSKGVPFIDEPASPYHLMPLFWYKKMAAEWVAEYRNKILSKWQKIEGKGYRNKQTGKMISLLTFAKMKSPRNWQVSKNDLPEWPEEAKPVEES